MAYKVDKGKRVLTNKANSFKKIKQPLVFCKWAVRRGNRYVPEAEPASKKHLSSGSEEDLLCLWDCHHLPLEILSYKMESVCSAIEVTLSICTRQRYHVVLNPPLGMFGVGMRSFWASKVIELDSELLEGRDWVFSSIQVTNPGTMAGTAWAFSSPSLFYEWSMDTVRWGRIHQR